MIGKYPKSFYVDILGKAISGNGRLANGKTLAEVKPKKYANPLTDYVKAVIARIKNEEDHGSSDL